MIQQLYTLPQVAKMLGVSIPTLRKWGSRGRMSFVRLPGGTLRVREDELERIMTGAPAHPVSAENAHTAPAPTYAETAHVRPSECPCGDSYDEHPVCATDWDEATR